MEETSLFSSSGISLIAPVSWSLYISGRLSQLSLSLKSSLGTIPVLHLHLGLDEPWMFSSQFQPEPTQWLNWCLLWVPVILVKGMAYVLSVFLFLFFCQFQVLADNSAATCYPHSNSRELLPPLSPIGTTYHNMIDDNSNSLPPWEVCVGLVTHYILKLQRRYFLSSNEKPRAVIISLSVPVFGTSIRVIPLTQPRFFHSQSRSLFIFPTLALILLSDSEN